MYRRELVMFSEQNKLEQTAQITAPEVQIAELKAELEAIPEVQPEVIAPVESSPELPVEVDTSINPKRAAKKAKKAKKAEAIKAKQAERAKKRAEKVEKPILSLMQLTQNFAAKCAQVTLKHNKAIRAFDDFSTSRESEKQALFAYVLTCATFAMKVQKGEPRTCSMRDCLNLIAHYTGKTFSEKIGNSTQGYGILRLAHYRNSKDPEAMRIRVLNGKKGIFKAGELVTNDKGQSIDGDAITRLYTIDGRISANSGSYVALSGHKYPIPDESLVKRACEYFSSKES